MFQLISTWGDQVLKLTSTGVDQVFKLMSTWEIFFKANASSWF